VPAQGTGEIGGAEPDWSGVSGQDPSAPIEGLALKLLAVREHSRLELERKLRVRGFDGDLVDAVIERLTRSGAIDEARMAELYVSERAGKGFGPLRIRAELAERGLAEDLFSPYLHAMEGLWPEYLAAAHDRRFGAGPPADRSDYAKRGRFLERRGFPAGMIRRVLRWKD
jgi:regulatory protein